MLTEVGELQVPFRVDQNVVRFEIPVHDPFVVEVLESQNHLSQVLPRPILGERPDPLRTRSFILSPLWTPAVYGPTS